MQDYKEKFRDFFNKLYDLYSHADSSLLLRPYTDDNAPMFDLSYKSKDDWSKWTLLPCSNISEKDIEELEQEFYPYPQILLDFNSIYYHFFECVSINPYAESFYALKNSYNDLLVEFDYIPFSWDNDGYYIMCLKKESNLDSYGMHYKVYKIDHEILFDLDEDEVTKEDLDAKMLFVSDNFMTYLNEIYINEEQNLIK